MLSTALAHVIGTLKRLAGVTVVYSQGGAQVTLIAVPAQTPVELLAGNDGVNQQVRYTDWLVSPADLVPGGVQTEPKRNATLEVQDTRHKLHGCQFVVTAVPFDRKVWRYSDEHGRTWIRVHTVMTSDGNTV